MQCLRQGDRPVTVSSSSRCCGFWRRSRRSPHLRGVRHQHRDGLRGARRAAAGRGADARRDRAQRLSGRRQRAGAAVARHVRVPHRQCAASRAEFNSETARIDLNAAPKELLAGLFVGLGAPRASADSYADRIIGWRIDARAGKSRDEPRIYRAAGLTYSPRGAPFQHVGGTRPRARHPRSDGRARDAVSSRSISGQRRSTSWTRRRR